MNIVYRRKTKNRKKKRKSFWFNAGGWKLVPGPYDNITTDDNRSVNF